MPFVPIDQVTDRRFPRVSVSEQAARDTDAEQIVASEFSQDMPDANRVALESEYSQRFGKEVPQAHGFIPIAQADDQPHGFVPLENVESERPSILRNVLLNNPLSAIGEAALNLGSQAVALPFAGVAGISAAAANAVGLGDAAPADVVRDVGSKLTYEPRGEFGKAAAGIVAFPFEKLAQGGRWAGDKTYEATDSPAAAAAVDTAINMIPMVIAPAVKGARAIPDRITARRTTNAEPTATSGTDASTSESLRGQDANQSEIAQGRATGDLGYEAAGRANTEQRGFIPINEVSDGSIQEGAQRLASDEAALPEAGVQGLEALRRQGGDDLPAMDRQLQPVPEGYGAGADTEPLAGQAGRGGPLRTEELSLDDARASDEPARILSQGDYPRPNDDSSRGGTIARAAKQELGFAPLREQSSIRESAIREVVPKIDMADAQRRGSTDTGMGEEDRYSERFNSEENPSRLAGGVGIESEAIPKQKDARYALIEADDLKPSHDTNMREIKNYPENFQRPDWTRRDAESRVQGIVAEFEPSRLVNSLDDAGGSPIAHRDGTIEAGSARTIALQRIYQANGQKAADYRQYIKENANQFGLDPAAIDTMQKPVLVRIPDEPAPRIHSDAQLINAAAEALKPIRDNGQPLGDALEHQGIEVGKLSAETTEAIRFLHDNPERAGEFAERVKVAMARPDGSTTADLAGSRNEPATHDMAAGVQNGTWNPGAQYTPFVDQIRAPAIEAKTVADLPSPIRREQIIGDLAKGLGTTIYEGRVKGKNRLGFFRPKVSEVRIKRANDIEVAAHEIAHLIDHRVPEIANTWRSDKAIREELKSVSYDQKSVPEGFAEGVRLFLTQPDVLEARAPKVHAWLESFADSHKYGPALRKAQADMTAWFSQDALNRARSKIGTDKPLAEYFDRFWDNFRQSTVDDLHGVYQMERDMTGKIAPNGPYESARMSRASASIADGAVRFGHPVKLPDGSFRFAGKGLEEILKPVAESLDDALLYFVGRSSRELMSQGREHLFTNGEIDAMLRLRTPEREQAFKDYQEWNRGILDFAEAENIINPESRRLWQRTQYLPFHRVEQPGGIKGKPGDWSGIQALTGGTTNIKDVLGNMIGNAAMLLDKAVKNEARLKIAKLSQQEGGGTFMVKIDSESRPIKISGDQVLYAMLKKYGIAIDGEAPAFFQFLMKGQPPAGNNVVAVMQHGKPVWFEVGDPILYRALTAIDRPIQGAVIRMLGLPKRVGQMTVTLTPDFMLANIARDTIMGSVMSRAGFRPVIDSLKGMRLRLTNDPIYKDYIANGGGLSSIYLDEQKFRTKLEKFYGRQGIDYRTVLDSPSKLLHFVETAADAFEMSSRLGEYKRAVDRGENPRHAAYLGRDVSTDFAMRGDSKALGFLYDTVMFLRPAVVSWDRLYRGIAHDPNKGAIAAKTGIVALASMALYLMNRDDPRYADLPDWDRDTNWHFFIGDQHFRYPKIWEIGAIASTAERTVEKLMATDPAGLGKDFARILGQTFSLNLMPQILAPLAEQATNRNSFTKAPIETPGMENEQPFLRTKPGTSETMKAAGMATRDLPEDLQINPVRAEALLRGYFNTYAMYGLMLTDKSFFGDKLPEGRTDQLPMVRRFYSQEPAQHTKFETQFYDMMGEAKRLQGTLKELDKMGRTEIADQKEKSPLAGEAKPLERAAHNLAGINHDMLAVRRDATLSPEEKRAKLDALTVERNALLKGAVTDAKAAQKEKGAAQ